MNDDELEAVLLYQFGALSAVVRGLGGRIEHVKCHGALAFDISYDEAICAAMIRAVHRFDPEMIVIFMARSPGPAYAKNRGLRVAAEGYIDRGYDSGGRLVPRDHPLALLKTPGQTADRAVELICEGKVTSVSGERIDLDVDTLCLHCDTEGAGEIAAAVWNALKSRGVAPRPLGEITG